MKRLAYLSDADIEKAKDYFKQNSNPKFRQLLGAKEE